jgi:hypothetical protein
MARGDKTLEIKFRIDEDLNTEIRQAAEKHGWGVSEEIRRRLRAGSGNSPTGVDDPTKRLLNAIAGIARDVRDAFDVGWRDGDPLANRVFTRSVRDLLMWADFAPEDETKIATRAAKPGSAIDRLQRDILSKYPDRSAINAAAHLGTIAAGREGFI